MRNWANLFSSYTDSGVFYEPSDVKSADVKKAAVEAGLRFFRIDLRNVNDKTRFLRKIARALKFPAYFGMNWDALSDSITDMSWMPAAGYVLFLANYRSFEQTNAVDIRIIRQILDSSAEFWKQKQVRFYIILA